MKLQMRPHPLLFSSSKLIFTLLLAVRFAPSIRNKAYKSCVGKLSDFNQGGYLVPFFTVAPENASLSTNLSSVPVVCAGMFVNFTCTVEGSNPTVDSFTLYANGRVISKKNLSGVWIETLDACGEVMYQCQANNFIGTSSSNKTLFFVEGEAMKFYNFF